MPVWGAWFEDAFFFGSGRESAKSRNLAANPAVVVHLESGDQTVIIEGRAEHVLDKELEQRWTRRTPRNTTGSPTRSTRPRGSSFVHAAAIAWTERGYPATPPSSTSRKDDPAATSPSGPPRLGDDRCTPRA
jgi:hypothetical protein